MATKTTIVLRNETRFVTSELRRLLREGAKVHAVSWASVHVIYGRHMEVRWRTGSVFTLTVPTGTSSGRIATAWRFALLRSKGVKLRDMTDGQRNWSTVPFWSRDVREVEKKPKVAKVKAPKQKAPLRERRADHAAKKLAEARKRVKQAEARLKAARTVEKRWVTKVKYYEREAKKRVAPTLRSTAALVNEAATELDDAFKLVVGR